MDHSDFPTGIFSGQGMSMSTVLTNDNRTSKNPASNGGSISGSGNSIQLRIPLEVTIAST